MKLKQWLPLLCCLLLGSTMAMAEPKWVNQHTENYFGTVTVLRVHAEPDEAAAIWTEIKQMLHDIEQSVSLSVQDSDISRFNALPGGSSMRVTDATADVMMQAKALYQMSDGWYDPTVYPLVDLWGFSPRFNTNKYQPVMPYDRAMSQGTLPRPDAGWIDGMLPLVGFDGIALEQQADGWYLIKQTQDVTVHGTVLQAQLDLGGMAKGYACDLAKEILLRHGCTDGYFSCGGSSIAVLKNAASEDGCFEVALKKPREGVSKQNDYGTVRVADTCLSTSNDISHCRYYDGEVYAHIVDPHTGWPVNTSDQGAQPGVISVTLFADSAAECDALTTGLMLMGLDRATAWLDAHPTYQAVLVCETGEGLRVYEQCAGMSVTYCDDAYQSDRSHTGN